ncbi:MAG: hypothetical protein GY749_25185 [Desulfobacteraceae bacterium]|nr:hypothetical protein [Desulfobacteraceae bacterium]
MPEKERDEALQAARIFCTAGDIQPLCDFIEQHCFRAFDNRDYRWANELTVKTAFLSLLFNDAHYIISRTRKPSLTGNTLILGTRKKRIIPAVIPGKMGKLRGIFPF